MENSECLFGRYASTKDGEKPDIQKLIKRAQSDMARLGRREETRR